ncbi:MAG TPA: DUF2382 domain-containing protein [Blastocatellia bacterium]|nr:DUF2382 domain-containing protein [Blastocatellia bacterium]
MKSILIGLFDNRSRAQTVAQELIGAGIDRGDVCLVTSESEFRNAVADMNLSPDDTTYYLSQIRRGAAAVTAAASPDRVERAAQIMRAYKARAAGQSGLEGERMTRGEREGERMTRGLREDERMTRGEREMAFPVIEEELRIGKRMVERGGVRIYNRVTERPIEQQVNLREERVKVEHRRADRIASEQDMNMFKESRGIELTEMIEEPVVAKEPHVVEEVIISKEVVDHPETIRDTVRRTEVEVERLAGVESGRAPAQTLGEATTLGAAQAPVSSISRASIPDDLHRLRELEGFEVAEGDIDPRGWELIGRDGEKIGKIDGLLVSPSARKAYFALVNTGGWLQNKLFAIPLSVMTFDRHQKSARAPYLKKQFHGAPEFRDEERNFQRYNDYWTGLGGGELTSAAGSGRR